MDFAIFTMWLPAVCWTDGQTNGQTDKWMDGPMDGPMDRQCFSLIRYTYAINTSENDDFPTDFAFFTKALPMDQQTNGPTDASKIAAHGSEKI